MFRRFFAVGGGRELHIAQVAEMFDMKPEVAAAEVNKVLDALCARLAESTSSSNPVAAWAKRRIEDVHASTPSTPHHSGLGAWWDFALTKAQRRVVLGGLFSIVVIGMFPPWTMTSGSYSLSLGFHFILSPPDGMGSPSPNLSRIVVEVFAVAATTFFTCLLLRARKSMRREG
jgi:hypothetical protein